MQLENNQKKGGDKWLYLLFCTNLVGIGPFILIPNFMIFPNLWRQTF